MGSVSAAAAPTPHAVIIGGGPAGSSAAIGLVQRGWRVTLIESKPFPRLKVCGEFISPAAIDILERFLAPEALRAAGAHRVATLILERDHEELDWPLPGDAERRAWVLSRTALDTLLIDAARNAGAALLQPAIVRRVDYHDGGIEVATDAAKLHGDVVIHADGHGRHDAPAASGKARIMPMRRGVIGLMCHLRCPTGRAAALRMRSCNGAYVGVVEVEGGLTTVALVARGTHIADCGGDADELLRRNWPAYQASMRVSPWVSTGIARSGYIDPGHPRSFRIGNAAAAVEPVGGEGIGLALWSGAMLTEFLDPAHADMKSLASAQRAVARRYRSRLRWRGPSCALAAWVLMRPRLVRCIWPMLRLSAGRSAILHPWYRLSGKPI